MNDHLTKPLDVLHMYEVIGKWIQAMRAVNRGARGAVRRAETAPDG